MRQERMTGSEKKWSQRDRAKERERERVRGSEKTRERKRDSERGGKSKRERIRRKDQERTEGAQTPRLPCALNTYTLRMLYSILRRAVSSRTSLIRCFINRSQEGNSTSFVDNSYTMYDLFRHRTIKLKEVKLQNSMVYRNMELLCWTELINHLGTTCSNKNKFCIRFNRESLQSFFNLNFPVFFFLKSYCGFERVQNDEKRTGAKLQRRERYWAIEWANTVKTFMRLIILGFRSSQRSFFRF